MLVRFQPSRVTALILAVCGCLWLAAATPAAGEIFIVDCTIPTSPPIYSSISEAVTAAETNGPSPDTIVVRPCGTPSPDAPYYNESIFIPAGAAGLHILAADLDSPDLLGTGPVGVDAADGSTRPIVNGVDDPLDPCITVMAERVSIQGLQLVDCGGPYGVLGGGSFGIRALSNAKLLRVHDVVISGVLGPGIEVVGADAPSLTSNRVVNTTENGIRLHAVADGFVADNTIHSAWDVYAAGILISGGSQDTTIIGNKVEGSWGPGIHDQDAARTRILRNTALYNCVGMVGGSCLCDQILVGAGAADTDVAGNNAQTGATDGISFCAPTTAEEKENPGF